MKFLSCTLIAIFSFLCASTFAQTVSGEWYGVGHTKRNGAYNSYLSEMVLKQKGNKVTGVFKYYFKSDSIKVKVTGTYFPKYRRLELNASPILNFQAKNANGADCPMEGGFTLMVSSIETTLTGQFNPTYNYRIVCPAIDIQFVKYVPSKNAPVIEEDETDTVPATAAVDTIRQNQTIKDTLTLKKPTVANNPRPATVVTRTDTANRRVPVPSSANPTEDYIRQLYRRTFAPSEVIEVDADSLVVNFYDNGEIDNDTISVFYNRKPVVLKQMLSKEPVSVSLKLDSTVNEISMFADNLGTISPNTAVAIIYAGTQRYELTMSSTLLTNATIRFRKKLKNKDPKNIN